MALRDFLGYGVHYFALSKLVGSSYMRNELNKLYQDEDELIRVVNKGNTGLL